MRPSNTTSEEPINFALHVPRRSMDVALNLRNRHLPSPSYETIVHEPGLCSRSSETNFTDLDGGALFNKNIEELFTDPQLQ
mmetsp:Transcript_6771/g.8273  ORF Transcript_6771/g.8273 Transcript_6771/m.8273 type:complete len:81 (-) Transcript_6771:150-392(-)